MIADHPLTEIKLAFRHWIDVARANAAEWL